MIVCWQHPSCPPSRHHLSPTTSSPQLQLTAPQPHIHTQHLCMTTYSCAAFLPLLSLSRLRNLQNFQLTSARIATGLPVPIKPLSCLQSFSFPLSCCNHPLFHLDPKPDHASVAYGYTHPPRGDRSTPGYSHLLLFPSFPYPCRLPNGSLPAFMLKLNRAPLAMSCCMNPSPRFFFFFFYLHPVYQVCPGSTSTMQSAQPTPKGREEK